MLVPAAVRRSVGRWLETGVLAAPWSRALANGYAMFAVRALPRPLAIPPGVLAVSIGGATLGGSGKTRVALAAVSFVASRGANVVLVGHGYRARRPEARVVLPTDALFEVGDEALACARALTTTSRARVVIGPSRQAAVDFACRLRPRPDLLVIDGPLQLSPRRSSLSILALDAEQPWGSGELPPAGDLRAPRAALLAHADHVVHVTSLPSCVVHGGRAKDLASFARSIATSRIGLFTALARPHRLVGALRRAGISPSVVVHAPDHGPIATGLARRIRGRADVWLATAKCAVHLEALALDAPVAALVGSVDLPGSVERSLADLLTSTHTRHTRDAAA